MRKISAHREIVPSLDARTEESSLASASGRRRQTARTRTESFRPDMGTPFANVEGATRWKERTMTIPTAAYVVAICAMLFSAISAVSLIYFVGHLDPPDQR